MSLGDAARLAREGSGFVWLASSDPGPDDLDELAAAFDLPALAVEDARAGHQRPKLAGHGEGAFLILKTVRHGEAQIEIGELDIFLARACDRDQPVGCGPSGRCTRAPR